MKLLSLFLGLILLGSCHKTGLPIQSKNEQGSISSVPSILFLQVKVTKKEETYTAKISNKMVVTGILNRDARGIQMLENQWLVSFFDKENQLLDQVTVLNPLDERFEVADDNGQFKGVEVKKEEAEFFFRVPYNPRFSTVQVEQILSIQNKKKLFLLTF